MVCSPLPHRQSIAGWVWWVVAWYFPSMSLERARYFTCFIINDVWCRFKRDLSPWVGAQCIAPVINKNTRFQMISRCAPIGPRSNAQWKAGWMWSVIGWIYRVINVKHVWREDRNKLGPLPSTQWIAGWALRVVTWYLPLILWKRAKCFTRFTINDVWCRFKHDWSPWVGAQGMIKILHPFCNLLHAMNKILTIPTSYLKVGVLASYSLALPAWKRARVGFL